MDNFQEDSTGILYIVNGFDPMIRWDGRTAQTELAGLTAPLTAPTLAGSGVGGIVGTYTAYVRFLDRFGFQSDLSPISDALDASSSGTTGNITGASFTAPIVITSNGHGLATGGIVKVSNVAGNTSANGTWIVTVINANTFSLDGSSGNATYTGSGTWVAGISTITYSSVAVPTDPKVVTRQILRNTDGEANTYYVDVETSDLTSTSFTSTKTDTTLAAGESQAILDDSGQPFANINGVPPSWKTSLASHLSRLFLAGQYREQRGAVIVTNGSATVQGVGTDWVSTLAGRVLNVVGALNSYDILSVDTTAQTLTLSAIYSDTSDNFALYSITPPPAERRLVYYTPAGLPESWPAVNALSIQEDGDEITGLMARGSFLYILEKRHIYKFTFQEDPAVDGAIFLSANRGCINNRCWILVDNDAYMLDEFGMHKFSSGGEITAISENIGNIFRPQSGYKFAINWKAYRFFHAVLYRPQSTIRWFVALEGDFLPHHALCYNYRLERWWIERYPFIVGGGCSGHISNTPYVFISGESTKTYSLWSNTTDIANPTAGTVRGNPSSSGALSLTDVAANFLTSGIGSIINAPVVITDGSGKGQTRRIISATNTSLVVDIPWTTTLDTTSVYQIGGVSWVWKSTWWRLSRSELMADRSIELLYLANASSCTMDVRTRGDFDGLDVQKQSFTSKQGGGVRTDTGLPDKVVDLTKPSGTVLIRIPGNKENFTDGRRYMQMELAGSTNKNPVSVFEVIVEGMGPTAQVTTQG